jgi:hypothetical protein
VNIPFVALSHTSSSPVVALCHTCISPLSHFVTHVFPLLLHLISALLWLALWYSRSPTLSGCLPPFFAVLRLQYETHHALIRTAVFRSTDLFAYGAITGCAVFHRSKARANQLILGMIGSNQLYRPKRHRSTSVERSGRPFYCHFANVHAVCSTC